MAKERTAKPPTLHNVMFELGEIELTEKKHVNDQTIHSFKIDIDNDIETFLLRFRATEGMMHSNYIKILEQIGRKKFRYLSVLNQADCTINSTFNIIVNYAIYSQSLDISHEEAYGETYEILIGQIRTYLKNWYKCVLEIIRLRRLNMILPDQMIKDYKKEDEVKIKQVIENYQKENEVKIEQMIDLLFRVNKLKLRYIHCCSLLLHIIIYTKCITEHFLNDDIISGPFQIASPATYGHKDEGNDIEKYYIKETIISDAPHSYRRSNRYANYLLELFIEKFGKTSEKVLLLNDLKSEKELSIHIIAKKTKEYKCCFVKYHGTMHSNVILFKFKYNGKIDERILIDDSPSAYGKCDDGTTRDKNGYILTYVLPGFYINHSKHKSNYGNGELESTNGFHIPSALLFKGGFIQSILLVILIIAIIVCVVIYIHDRKYVKAQQIILDKK